MKAFEPVARPSSVFSHWRYTTRQWLWAGIDIIFPPHCGGCHQAGLRFCSACQQQLHPLAPPLCRQCGYPLQHPTTSHLKCHIPANGPLAGLRSVAYFEGPLRHALHRLKYQRDVILADSLAQFMHRAWGTFAAPGEVVVPVPLSAQRLRERGYNQAGLLARAFAELSGLIYAPAALQRTRHTQSQITLSAHARQANVAGAFQAHPQAIRGRAVILVDDVCTTGATLLAAAEALRSAGAAGVWGFTLGRAHEAA